MRRFLILMMLACLCNCTFAQSVVTGIVRDTIGTALEGVIVRVNADKATLGFARTSENGTYKITLKSDAKQLIVTAEAIGYDRLLQSQISVQHFFLQPQKFLHP